MLKNIILVACCLASVAVVESAYDKEKFKEIVINDKSNDDATSLTAVSIHRL